MSFIFMHKIIKLFNTEVENPQIRSKKYTTIPPASGFYSHKTHGSNFPHSEVNKV